MKKIGNEESLEGAFNAAHKNGGSWTTNDFVGDGTQEKTWNFNGVSLKVTVQFNSDNKTFSTTLTIDGTDYQMEEAGEKFGVKYFRPKGIDAATARALEGALVGVTTSSWTTLNGSVKGSAKVALQVINADGKIKYEKWTEEYTDEVTGEKVTLNNTGYRFDGGVDVILYSRTLYSTKQAPSTLYEIIAESDNAYYEESDAPNTGEIELTAGARIVLKSVNGRYFLQENLVVSTEGNLQLTGTDGNNQGYSILFNPGDSSFEYSILKKYGGFFSFLSNPFSRVEKQFNISSDGEGKVASVTICKRQKVLLERITDELAMVIGAGTDNILYKAKQADGWQDCTVENGLVKYGGATLLGLRTEGGVSYYDIYSGGSRLYTIGSDGSFRNYQAVEEAFVSAKTVEPDGKPEYWIDSLVSGGDMILRMEGRKASMLDNNDTAAEKRLNISAGGNLVIYSASEGSIGTDENPLEMRVGGKALFYNLDPDSTTVIETDTFVEIDKDGVYELGDTVIDGKLLKITGDGTVTGGKVDVIHGGELNTIVRDAVIDRITSEAGTKIGMDLTGSLTGKTWDISGTLEIDAAGDVAIRNLTIASGEDEKVTVKTGGGFAADTIRQTGGVDSTLDVRGDFTMNGEIIAAAGSMSVTVGGKVAVIDILTGTPVEADTIDENETYYTRAALETPGCYDYTRVASPKEGETLYRLDGRGRFSLKALADAIIIDDVYGKGGVTLESAKKEIRIDEMLTGRDSALRAAGDVTILGDAILSSGVNEIVAGGSFINEDSAAAAHPSFRVENAKLTLTAENDVRISHLYAANAAAALTANTGVYCGKTVEVKRSAVKISGYDGVKIFSDENDRISADEEFSPVITVEDSFFKDTITDPSGVQTNLGLTIVSENGGMDSTDSRFDIYRSEAGEIRYRKDGVWYQFKDGAFAPVETDETRFTLLHSGYSLFVTEDKTQLYLESGNKFYAFGADGTLGAAQGIDGNDWIYTLRNVGAGNYYDGWLIDRSTITVTVKGDVVVRDTLRMLESTGKVTSTAGSLTVADYFIDEDGDGVGDVLEASEWDLRGSVMEIDIAGSIRIDHFSLQISVMDMEVQQDSITGKTWYIFGSRLRAAARSGVEIVNMDDKYATPAVLVYWSNDDLSIRRRDTGEMEKLGVYVAVKEGGLVFRTGSRGGGIDNTTDLYATASTIDLDVYGTVDIAEMKVNTENSKNTDQTFSNPRGEELYGNDPDTVTHKDIFKDGKSMTDANFAQSGRAYGTEINIKSVRGGVPAGNWTIAGARLKDGSLNAGVGQSSVNVTTLGDIALRYNLLDFAEAERIAPRALTIEDGGRVTLASTEGGVTFTRDAQNIATPDALARGDAASGARAQLTVLSRNDLVFSALESEYADVLLRSTDANLFFDRIIGKKTNLRLIAAENIQARHEENNMIRFTDASSRADALHPEKDASLRLSAGGDIGSAERWLYVDVPEEIIVRVDRVRNLFLDGCARADDGSLRRDVYEYFIEQGYDAARAALAADALIRGDYAGYADERFYNVLLPALDQAALSRWILKRGGEVYRQSGKPHAWTNMTNVDLTDYIRKMVTDSRGNVTEDSIAAVFGGAFVSAARKEIANAASGYYQRTVLDVLLDAVLTGSDDAQLNALYAKVDARKIYDRLYQEGGIVYAYDLAGNAVSGGTMQDLINFLLNNSDAAYRDEILAAAKEAAVKADAQALSRLASQKAQLEAARDAAQTAVGTLLTERDAAQKTARSLAGQLAAEKAALANLTAQGANANTIAAQQKKVDALQARLTNANDAVAAKEAEIAARRGEAAAAQDEINALLPEIAQRSAGYAGYDRQGGSPNEADAQARAEAARTARDQGDLDGALNALDEAVAATNAETIYSEGSLKRANERAKALLDLAGELLDDARKALGDAETALQNAETEYAGRQTEQAEARIACENAETALANSRPGTAQYDAALAARDAARTKLDAAENALAAAGAEITARQAKVADAHERLNRALRGEQNAAASAYRIANTYIDSDARDLNVSIGSADGELYLYNEGHIGLTVDEGDATLGSLYSERGDVSVTADGGSIYGVALDGTNANRAGLQAGYENNAHVNGKRITLAAQENIGSAERTLVVEERANSLVKVVNATDAIQTGRQAGDANGSTEFGSIVGIETALRYEELARPEGNWQQDPYTLIPVTLIDADGRRVDAKITLRDLRAAYALSSQDGETVYVTFGAFDENGEQTGSALTVALRYDWLRVYDSAAGTELNANAKNGGIYLTELTGDVGAGEIRSAGNTTLTAETGAIASRDDRTTVAVGGEMTVNAEGGVNLNAEGNLTLNLNTKENHADVTTLGKGDITIVSGSDKALTGTAISGGSVTLVNGGDIGEGADAPFVIATDAANGGTVSLSGENISVRQPEGDLRVGEIKAGGNLNLAVGGSVLDTGKSGIDGVIGRVQQAQENETRARREFKQAASDLDLINYGDHVIKAREALAAARTGVKNAEAAAADTSAALAKATQAYAEQAAMSGESSEGALEALRQLNEAKRRAEEAEKALAAANEALEKAKADPVNALDAALEEIETARANGASAGEIAGKLDEAVQAYRKAYARNGDYTDLIRQRELELEQAKENLAAAGEAQAEQAAALDEAKQREADARAAYEALAADPNAGSDALENARKEMESAQQALAEAEEAGKQLAQDAEALKAKKAAAEDALKQAQNDTGAAVAALEAAEKAWKQALTALDYANSALDAQLKVNGAKDEGMRATAEYLLSAENARYDAYQDYINNPTAETRAAYEKACAAVDEARRLLISVENGDDATRESAKGALDALNKAANNAGSDAHAGALAAAKKEAAAQQKREDAQRARDEAQENADRAAETLKQANEAYDSARSRLEELNNADQTLEKAKKALDDANAALKNAQQSGDKEAVEAAEMNVKAAQETVRQAEALVSEAKNDNGNAQQALEKAYDAKAEAETADADAKQALAEAETAFANAKAALAEAEKLAGLAREAANRQTEREDAQKALDAANAERDALLSAPQELADAETALGAAKNAYEQAYQAYLDANTGIIPADEGSDDVKARREALDKAEAALKEAEDAREDARAKNEACEQAKDAAKAAQDALDRAEKAEKEAKDALAQAGPLPADETGAGFAPGQDDTGRPAAIVAGGDVTIVSGGDVAGDNGGRLTVDAEGKLTIDAKGDVEIASTKDVTIDEITAGGDADITAVGDITSTGKEPAIKADKIHLDAISTGDKPTKIGGEDGPLHVDAGELGARGGDVDVDVNGDVTLDDVVADRFDLDADGSVSQKDGTRIDAKDLDINANGDIGSKDDPLEIDSDRISAKGDDIFIDNKSSELIVDEIIGNTVDIKTDGDINTSPDGVIKANDLTINARDDIGKPDAPIRIDVSGKVDLNSLRGGVWYRNFFIHGGSSSDGTDAGPGADAPVKDGWRRLVDPESGVEVCGRFDKSARLEVINTNHLARLLYGALLKHLRCECARLTEYSARCAAFHSAEALQILIENAVCDGCGFLWNLIAESKTLYDFALGVFGEAKTLCDGRMYFMLDLEKLGGKPATHLEGETLYVLCCVDGRLVCIKTTVMDGSRLYFTLDRLGTANLGYTQFAVLDAETFEMMWQAGEIPVQAIVNAEGKTIETR